MTINMMNMTSFCDRDDCLVEGGGSGTMTAAYYPPVFDKQGVNQNPDRKVLTMSYKCRACGKTWDTKTVGQSTTIHNLKG